jgi:hypothetical protein
MSLVDIQRIERIRRFVRALKKRDELWGFFKALNDGGEAYLFGGAPRDAAFGLGGKVHDLDIFVSGPIDLDEMVRFSSIARRTNFGGLRLFVGSFEVDAWELQKSYAFRAKESSFVSAGNLLRSVCFSTDGVAVSLKSNHVTFTPAFRKSIEDRCLDFVVKPVALEPVVGARIARLALRLNLELTPAVAAYFFECLAAFGRGGLIEAELRWGNHRILNDLLVAQLEARICSTENGDTFCP